MSSMNSFTRSRPSQTPDMIDREYPEEEASSCDITVYFHSPSWAHTAGRGIESLLMAHWKNPLVISVVLKTLDSLVLREDRRPLEAEGLTLCSVRRYFCSYTSTVCVHLISRRPPRASPNRVASAQNARQQKLVNLGANLRGENWRVVVGLLLHWCRVLFKDDSKGVNGDVSQVGAVPGKPMPMLKFAQYIA